MLKIITFIITKLEYKLSKKEKKVRDKYNPSDKLQLYRDLLNFIDRYNYKTTGINTIRHYRFFKFTIDDIEIEKVDNQ